MGGLLDCLDLSQSLEKEEYQDMLALEQARLAMLMRDKRMRRHALVAVFEGNDAAGKGGAIRRVAAALDPRQYRIVPVAAPTEEERARGEPAHGGPPTRRLRRHILARFRRRRHRLSGNRARGRGPRGGRAAGRVELGSTSRRPGAGGGPRPGGRARGR